MNKRQIGTYLRAAHPKANSDAPEFIEFWESIINDILAQSPGYLNLKKAYLDIGATQRENDNLEDNIQVLVFEYHGTKVSEITQLISDFLQKQRGEGVDCFSIFYDGFGNLIITIDGAY